jgi:hypothetical protein
MTYTLGSYVSGMGTNPPAPENSTPEGSAWYKVTPTVLAWLGATYPNDAAMRSEVIDRVARELVFIGIPPGGDEIFLMSAGSTGNFVHSSTASPYVAPPGAPRMTFQQVLDVFEIRGGGPRFKRRQASNINWGLWAGVGAGVVALLGLGYLAINRQKAPKPLTSNRRRALKPNDRRWEMEQYYRSPHGSALMRSQRTRNREEAAYRMWEELTRSFTDERGVTHAQSPDDRRAAYDLVREAYPDVDLGFPRPGGLTRNPVYALPERKAYPITSRKDAYHATQRLKQGRVKDEADAKRIIAAIKRTHPDIWREYLEGYSVSKIMTSKRKGLTARRRA